MVKGHRIEKKIEIQDYFGLVHGFDESNIVATNHTFFRLSEVQRKVFKEQVTKYILRDTPILVGLQYNKTYAVFYKHGKDVLKVILDIHPNQIVVVTLYIVGYKQIPKI